MPVIDGIKATEEITLTIPETTVIVMSVQERPTMSEKLWRQVRDFLCKPFNGDELSDTIVKTYETETMRRKRAADSGYREELRSRVVTVFSTKGGVGKTTIASNLAVSMARTSKTNRAG